MPGKAFLVLRNSLTMPGNPARAGLLLKAFYMYYLYILYSVSSALYYVGHTNNPVRRLTEHNNSEMSTYTSKHRPWILKAVFSCGEREAEAIRIERFIKKQKSQKLLERIIAAEPLTGILAQLVRVPTSRDQFPA
ncbi:putative endonuclease [Pedobacter sp. UYP30]|uniref:GIY-YIG nuclease family protein n=1 Tax=Pedobacter sp. UYP30 TaxID=1756400 RepID=UPI003393AB20